MDNSLKSNVIKITIKLNANFTFFKFTFNGLKKFQIIFTIFNKLKLYILTDDLSIAEDFFEYFAATLKILQADPSLFCISAWNDNGKSFLIQNDPELLHRSDFFPGLGWMMTRLLWEELKDKWPKGFWDDWLREADQRKGRACIRPEISRTAMTEYGKNGVSRSILISYLF
ncbi:alpha-1,3-mannosyl-glyco protein 2-beta-N-acetylglucosaminyltransferase [Trichinella spiralis]|uniref:alpha-1,3-mannosyl-glyco protein 2-beta-N-acetylglucosaminyltransferase n=1 Tax=Trichinella spiralis TaxID=6334 RepID=UPI0001EFD735|nr:alpha-1,3-mannosyl-glyco protein 2-beta-N-acetylglucosaminyltransferase [Trichinella spiralis]